MNTENLRTEDKHQTQGTLYYSLHPQYRTLPIILYIASDFVEITRSTLEFLQKAILCLDRNIR